MPGIIAVEGDDLDPAVVPSHRNSPLPVEMVVLYNPAGSGGPVLAGPEKLPVATVGTPIVAHGNPSNPKINPGYNPTCGHATIQTGSSSVLVNGKPVATIGSVCTCTHLLAGPGVPTITVGR
jgi:uncharacterized Zn-binding protein involved in type VI secretion